MLQYKLHSFIQDDGSTRGLLAKPLKKFPKSPIRPAGSHFCSASCGALTELPSNIIKTRGILSTPESDVHRTAEDNRHSDQNYKRDY